MFNIVLSVLVATFLLGMGVVTGAGVVLGLGVATLRGDIGALPVAIMLFPFAALFLGMGTLVMLRTITSLRGTPPRGAWWERWAAMIDQPLFNNRRR